MWNLIAVVCVLLFAMAAVWVRRHYDTEELAACAAAGFVVLGVVIVVAGWNEKDFLYGPLFGAMLAGIVAAASTVEWLARRSPDPDAVVHTVIACIAFGGGALVGFYVGFLFSLSGLAWIG